jgi:hypothetical protein
MEVPRIKNKKIIAELLVKMCARHIKRKELQQQDDPQVVDPGRSKKRKTKKRESPEND